MSEPSRYGKIDVRVWKDERVRRLSRPQPNARDLFLYLLAPRERIALPGVIPAGAGAMADTLGWSREAFLEAFGEVSREGLAEADWEAGLVFVPNAIRYNRPASPNVITSWRELWADLPESPLLGRIWSRLEAEAKAMGRAWHAAFLSAIPKPPEIVALPLERMAPAAIAEGLRKGFPEAPPKAPAEDPLESENREQRTENIETTTPLPPPRRAPRRSSGLDAREKLVVVEGEAGECWGFIQEQRLRRGLARECAVPRGFSDWLAEVRQDFDPGEVAQGIERFLDDPTLDSKATATLMRPRVWPQRIRKAWHQEPKTAAQRAEERFQLELQVGAHR